MTFKRTKYNSLLFGYLYHMYSVYKPKQGDQNKTALTRMFRLCENMLFHYSKVFVVRIDLHPKHFSPDNKIMSIFLRRLITRLEKQYQCKVGYFCAREQNKSDKQHYHLALMLSGHKIQHSDKLLTSIKIEWEHYCHGTVNLVENPYYTMRRGNKTTIDPVVYRLSYLTKNHTKALNNPANSYLCNESKLRPDVQHKSNYDRLLVDPHITHQQFKAQEEHNVSTCNQGENDYSPTRIVFNKNTRKDKTMPRLKKQYSVTLSDETVALLHILGERMSYSLYKNLNRSLTIEALALFASQISASKLQAFTHKHGIEDRELTSNDIHFEAMLTAVQIRNSGRAPFDMAKHTVEEYLQPYPK